MFNSLTSLFKELLEGTDLSTTTTMSPNQAIACLLYEVAGADHDISEQEQEIKHQLIKKLLNVDDAQAQELLDQAAQINKNAASLYEFTSQLRELSREARFELIKAMWQVAHSDGKIDPLEDAVIRKTAELIYVDHSEFIRAKLLVTEGK